MRTNFQMIRDLEEKFKPVKRGILTGEEVDMIREELCLTEMDLLQLRNLRDFTVLYFSSLTVSEKDPKQVIFDADRLSGITSVIDTEIFKKGGTP